MFLLCYRHHCDDFWSLINFLHWSLSLKQYFKFSQSSNYFDITMPTMHRSYLISQECLSATICAPHDLSVSLTGNRVTHSWGVRLAYLGIWALAVWFSDWYSLWAAFLPRSRHHGGPPCLPGHTHLTQQLRLGSALITNTKHWTETTGMIRNTKYVNGKPAPQILRTITIRLDFLGFLYIKSHVRLINCPLTSGSFR